ncbi:MAG: helix-turn-helix domain-containing protein [Betaproteobacteria bacterium]|nr:helix-turn-helix domain-containing protein [Betaproteobacteria bacterium]MBI2959084.1 helix-turn-helix domain-containing protein [Betaproteobacteria bacterium]
MATPESEDFVRAFARGLEVIEAMGAGAPRKTIAQIAEATKLPRSVVRRLLMTLCAQRYAQSDGRLFALTPRALKLGLSYLDSLPFWRYAQPALEDLRSGAQESCSMAVLDGEEIVYVLRIPSRRILAMNLSVGSRLPAHVVSLGRVLLAHLDKQALRRYLEVAELEPRTPRSITKPGALKGALEIVQRQGYAWVDGELDPAICGIAVPVRDAASAAVAAISVSFTSGTYDEAAAKRKFLVPLRQAAERIRSAMPG